MGVLPPQDAESTLKFHHVVAGDTLTGLAYTAYGDAGKASLIYKANLDKLDDPKSYLRRATSPHS
jgi:nucleoid-associated protein YgaU